MDQEREAAPQPTAVPATAAPAATPAVAAAAPALGGITAAPGPNALSIGGLLALQRSAGNAAVTNMLARDAGPAAASGTPAAPPAGGPREGPLAASEITVAGGEPQPQGAWAMVPKVEADLLTLASPEVHFSAELSVAEPADKRKIPSTSVGFIQTVKSADRQGVYTRDGTPGGTPVAHKHTSVSGKRDVLTNMVGDASGNVEVDPATGQPVQLMKAPPPWYDNPSYLDDQQRTTSVETKDRTKAAFPLEIETNGKKGRLSQTTGADKFQMAVSAKQGDAGAFSLKSTDWESPWNSTIDPATHQASKTGAVWVHPSDVPLNEQKEPTGVANKDKIDWVTVSTVADAKALGAQQCLSLLPLARQYDQESYEAIATALRELNPLLGIDVGTGDGQANTVQVEAEGARGVHSRSVTTPGVAAFHLLDFFDPNDLTGSVAITVRVTGPKGGAGQTSWASPFGGASLSVDGIQITCRLGGSSMGPVAPVSASTPAGPAPPPPPAPPPAAPKP